MKKERNFISAMIADSMMDGIAQLDGCIKISYVSLDELKGLEFFSLIRNQALVGTLREKGINCELCSDYRRVILQSGDTLYVINPGREILSMADNDILPEDTTLTVKKYVCW
jgi:hypothetical protein